MLNKIHYNIKKNNKTSQLIFHAVLKIIFAYLKFLILDVTLNEKPQK